ncbi:MAG: hypothetical protein ACI9K2_004009, partial [Myxococcota bacterium]
TECDYPKCTDGFIAWRVVGPLGGPPVREGWHRCPQCTGTGDIGADAELRELLRRGYTIQEPEEAEQ